MAVDERRATQMVEELFDAWYPCVVRYAASLIGSTDKAEDVVQQSFLELYPTTPWARSARRWRDARPSCRIPHTGT